MTPRAWLIAAGVAVALAVVGVLAWHHIAARADTAAMTQAGQHHEAAIASAAQGATHDQAVESQKPTLAADASAVSRLQAEVARLRAAAAHSPVPAPVPGVPEPEPVAPPVESVALAGAKDQLIDALTKENGDLKVQVLNLTAARDSWHTAYDESTKETAALRIAHEAALAAAKSNKWVGRIEGFAVGAAVGYAGGKL